MTSINTDTVKLKDLCQEIRNKITVKDLIEDSIGPIL